MLIKGMLHRGLKLEKLSNFSNFSLYCANFVELVFNSTSSRYFKIENFLLRRVKTVKTRFDDVT